MSRYDFSIQCSGRDEWFWEWDSFSDRSAYWLHLGPVEFSFGHRGTYAELATAVFNRRVAINALKRWAQPLTSACSFPRQKKSLMEDIGA